MANVLPSFPSFSVHEDNASVSPHLKKWLKHFEMYLTAHDVKDATRKKVLLLYSACEEVSSTFETLPDQGEEKDYAKAVTALNDYFPPKVNKAYEIYMCRDATQNYGESLDSYCTRLRGLAQTCEFDHEDEEIKSHIVVSYLSSRLRRHALREEMNLKELLDYGCGLEMSEKQAKGIEEQGKLAQSSDIQTVKEKKRKVENKKCYRCRENYPHKGRPCPAMNETCKLETGHFVKVCRCRSNSKKVNTVDENDDDDSTDEEYTYRITLHLMCDKLQPLT